MERFCFTTVQLLHKLRIRAKDSSETLMKVIKNPITAHLPAGALVIGADTKGDLIHPLDIVPTLPEGPVVFVMGAMAHGYITADYIERTYSFSAYPVRGPRGSRAERRREDVCRSGRVTRAHRVALFPSSSFSSSVHVSADLPRS